MAQGILTVDLSVIAANWRRLDGLTAPACRTGAVIKANAYGTGVDRVAPALALAGTRDFFVASVEEGAALRALLGPGPAIYLLEGHQAGAAPLLAAHDLVPMLGSPAEVARHFAALPRHGFGVALDPGMNRLGLEPAEWQALRGQLLAAGPRLLLGHLNLADEPERPENAASLALFREMTEGTGVARSLAATAAITLSPDYHFDMTRPGIALYGVTAPGTGTRAALELSLPVLALRDLAPGETVGYGATWTAGRPTRLATLGGGYADGIQRGLSNRGRFFAGTTPCPVAGRVSMDFTTVDVTDLAEVPDRLDLICPAQSVDQLAADAGTIGHVVMTGLGPRLSRHYKGAP